MTVRPSECSSAGLLFHHPRVAAFRTEPETNLEPSSDGLSDLPGPGGRLGKMPGTGDSGPDPVLRSDSGHPGAPSLFLSQPLNDSPIIPGRPAGRLRAALAANTAGTCTVRSERSLGAPDRGPSLTVTPYYGHGGRVTGWHCGLLTVAVS
eukprot:750431-Hanusia_phi.AAC.2